MYGSVSGCVLAPYPLSAVSTAPPAPKWLGLLERKIFHFFDSKEEVVTAMGMAARGEGKNAAVVVKRSSGG